MIPVLGAAAVIGSLVTLSVLAATGQLKFFGEDGPQAGPTTTISSIGADESSTTVAGALQQLDETTTTTERPAEVYVSPSGVDDASRGRTAERPVLSADFAIELALPGDTVFFAAGRYGPLQIHARDDLRIVGEPGTVFHSNGYAGAPGVHVTHSTNISLDGVTIEQALWGLKVEGATGFVVKNSIIRDVGQEGILISGNSTDVEIADNLITETGRREGSSETRSYSNYGEAIYLGTGGLYDDEFDMTSHIWVHGNEISFTTAEAIDIKPSVSHVQVEDNIIHDINTANSGAVVVSIGDRPGPDPHVVIERNIIFRVSRTSPWTDGNAIVLSAPATVRNNVMWDVLHYGIFLDSKLVSETPGSAVVYNNLVFETGREPILDSSLQLDAPVEIVILENLVGGDVAEFIAGVSRDSDVEFGRELIERLTDRADALAEAAAIADSQTTSSDDPAVPVETTVVGG